jgi:SAM-dependent methyltransferase
MADDRASHLAGPIAHIREHTEIIRDDLKTIQRLLPAPARVLDVGAGPATFVREARARGYDAIALDLEAAAGGVWSSARMPGVIADGGRLPFRHGVFGVVRIKEVIEHVADPRSLLVAASAVLTDGGYVIAHVPSPWSQLYPVANFWDDYTHVRPLTRRGLERLFDDGGFDVLSIHGYVAGRNPLERGIGAIIGRIVPHTYRIVAQVRRG